MFVGVTATEKPSARFCLLGALVGTLIGVLPGIGPLATISMLLPLTYHFEPVTALIMLAGIYYGARPLPITAASDLFYDPDDIGGEPSNAALDRIGRQGFPEAKQT
jgi:hypothetical protein